MLESARTLGSWGGHTTGGGSFMQALECGPQTWHVFWPHEWPARWRGLRFVQPGSAGEEVTGGQKSHPCGTRGCLGLTEG